MLLGQGAVVQTSFDSCHLWCRNTLSKILHFTAVTRWIYSSNLSFPLCQSASNQFIAACWALFGCTQNCLPLVAVIFAALYIGTSIAVQILWIFCSCNWLESLVNCSSSLAILDFDIVCTCEATFCLYNCFCVLCSAVRDRSEGFCWLSSRENSHSVCTAHITGSSDAVTNAVFLTSSELSWIGVQFNASVLLMPWIWFPCQELLFKNYLVLRCAEGLDIVELMWIDCQIDPWHF